MKWLIRLVRKLLACVGLYTEADVINRAAEIGTSIRSLSMQIDEGRFELTASMKSEVIPLITYMMLELLRRDGGEFHNFCEWEANPSGPDMAKCGPLLVSVTRVIGARPAQQIRELEDALTEAMRMAVSDEAERAFREKHAAIFDRMSRSRDIKPEFKPAGMP